MKSSVNIMYNVICWMWLAVLVLGLNVTMSFVSPGVLFFAILTFCLADLVLSRVSIIMKVLVSLLMIHRAFYVGSVFSRRWLGWLGADISKDISLFFNRGWLSPSPVMGMVLTLILLIVLQTLYFSFIVRRRGALPLLFAGSCLLTAASLWHGQSTAWYVILYVIIGLVIMGTTRVQARFTFPMQRWLSILLVWVLCITSVAWALPSGNLDLGQWYGKVQDAWERMLRREEGSGSASGGQVGYSSYDGELGGPMENDFTHVMTVFSPRAVYLTGETRNYYTGRGWRSEAKNIIDADYQLRPANVQGQEVEISIKMVVEHGRMLFVPRYALDFQFSDNNEVVVMRSPGVQIYQNYGDYEFRSQYPLQSGDTYKMTVLLPMDDPSVLRQASNIRGGDQHYLQLHPDIPQRVLDLARDLTAQEDNGYDKAMALVNYLRTGNWRYSLETEPTPSGRDFVDWFLFEQDRGYCVHFSTAFVVLARAAGLPARWVKGFSSGYPNGQGGYRVLNSHSHAWAELWFDDYGWVPFEATPGASMPSTGQGFDNTPGENPQIPAEPDVSLEPGSEPEPGEDIQGPGQERIGFRWWLAWVGAALAVGTGLMFTFRRPSLKRPNQMATAYDKLQRRLSLFGWQRYCWETPREHLARVHTLPDLALLAGFVQDLEESIYGGGHGVPDSNLKKRFSVFRLAMYRFFPGK